MAGGVKVLFTIHYSNNNNSELFEISVLQWSLCCCLSISASRTLLAQGGTDGACYVILLTVVSGLELIAELMMDFIESALQDKVWQPQLRKLQQRTWYSRRQVPQVLHQILAELDSGQSVDAHFVQRARNCFPHQWVHSFLCLQEVFSNASSAASA